MKKKLVTTIATTAIASGLLAFSCVSTAAPTWDFTDLGQGGWLDLDGESTTTVNGLTFTAGGGTITTNASFSDPSDNYAPCTAMFDYACDGDGLGVSGLGDADEIDSVLGSGEERITIEGFGGVDINQISFLDLFDEPRKKDSGGDTSNFQEIAFFYVNSNPFLHSISADSDNEDTNGFAVWNGLLENVNKLTFVVNCPAVEAQYGSTFSCPDNDYAVAAINAVPVPAAVWLFGSGLIGLVGIARRKRNAA